LFPEGSQTLRLNTGFIEAYRSAREGFALTVPGESFDELFNPRLPQVNGVEFLSCGQRSLSQIRDRLFDDGAFVNQLA